LAERKDRGDHWFGGLTHFVCDEQLDRLFLDCFSTCDLDRLAQVDERSYQSGTSEVKLFVPILIAMSELRFEMKLVDYVPCYRTEAGTGEGMGFIYWKS
jgi:seryl-tRNA synthetase